MNEINSFTIYREYYDLITLLSDEEQAKVLLAITKFMFDDNEMDLSEREKKVFINLKRPLTKSKEQSKRRTKQKPNENQNETGKETKTKPKGYPKENTSNDVYVNVHDNVHLENKGYGEKKPFKEIIDYLNQKANTHFKYNSKATQSKINARLNEGYSLDDFIAVIDKKCDEWKGTEFEQHLCPETLFGPKFEKYLNQKPLKPKTNNKPNWIEKDILEDKASDEEIKELEERLKRR